MQSSEKESKSVGAHDGKALVRLEGKKEIQAEVNGRKTSEEVSFGHPRDLQCCTW